MVKNKVYIHVAMMNRWEAILSEVIECCVISGLVDNADLTLVAVGGVLPERQDCRVVNTGLPLLEYEFPTLQLLYDELEENTNVCYLHLKGVSQPNSLGHRAWRRELCEFTLIEWRSRVHHLTGLYSSGPRVCQGGGGKYGDNVAAHKHYSGNFWWARSDYIKMLPNPSSFRIMHLNRYAAESWIGQNKLINDVIV